MSKYPIINNASKRNEARPKKPGFRVFIRFYGMARRAALQTIYSQRSERFFAAAMINAVESLCDEKVAYKSGVSLLQGLR